MTTATEALEAWNRLDSRDGLGSALHVGQMLADALTSLSRKPATSTPPADDVREALAAEAWAEYQSEHGYTTFPTQPDTGADFWAGFERGYDARLRGTVTDAEIDAAARAHYERSAVYGERTPWDELPRAYRMNRLWEMRAAPKAARGVRP